MNNSSFIGIDFGTSGCRACVVDGSGAILAEHALELPAPRIHRAEVSQDPTLWWSALQRLLLGLLEKLSHVQRSTLKALSIDGTSGTVLLADSKLVPQGMALMYSDSASTLEAARITELAPDDSAARGVASGLAKTLRLLPEDEGELRVHSQSDWLLHRLLGRRAAMDSNNALKLGWDAINNEWPAWLQGLDLPKGLLPGVVPAGTPLGTIDAAMASGLGLPADLVICAGTTDSTAAFIAAGARIPGEAVTSLGSTLVLKVLSEAPVCAPEFGVYSQPFDRLWLVGGASNSGGAVLRQYFSDGAMAAMTLLIDPDRPTGLDYYPLPGPGERFPFNDPQRPPRLAPRPDDDRLFFQGMLEGIAAIELQGYRLLAQLGAPYPASVRSCGGGAANPAWTAIRGRMLGVPMLPARHGEAAYGSALLARKGVNG